MIASILAIGSAQSPLLTDSPMSSAAAARASGGDGPRVWSTIATKTQLLLAPNRPNSEGFNLLVLGFGWMTEIRIRAHCAILCDDLLIHERQVLLREWINIVAWRSGREARTRRANNVARRRRWLGRVRSGIL